MSGKKAKPAPAEVANSEERAEALQTAPASTPTIDSNSITKDVLNTASKPAQKQMKTKPTEQEVVVNNLKSLRSQYNNLPAEQKQSQKGKMLQAEYLKAKKAAGSWADGF